MLITKAPFAVVAMLDIAIHSGQGAVTIAALAARHGKSISSLEQVFSVLRRHRLVVSLLGPGGGYLLSRSAREITVRDIVDAIDEAAPDDVARPPTSAECAGSVDAVWAAAEGVMATFLGSVSLDSLVPKSTDA